VLETNESVNKIVVSAFSLNSTKKFLIKIYIQKVGDEFPQGGAFAWRVLQKQEKGAA
jgi:hypothetical protein